MTKCTRVAFPTEGPCVPCRRTEETFTTAARRYTWCFCDSGARDKTTDLLT